jgi:hypothetical protein
MWFKDPFILDIIRSKEVEAKVVARDALNIEEEIFPAFLLEQIICI